MGTIKKAIHRIFTRTSPGGQTSLAAGSKAFTGIAPGDPGSNTGQSNTGLPIDDGTTRRRRGRPTTPLGGQRQKLVN